MWRALALLVALLGEMGTHPPPAPARTRRSGTRQPHLLDMLLTCISCSTTVGLYAYHFPNAPAGAAPLAHIHRRPLRGSAARQPQRALLEHQALAAREWRDALPHLAQRPHLLQLQHLRWAARCACWVVARVQHGPLALQAWLCWDAWWQ